MPVPAGASRFTSWFMYRPVHVPVDSFIRDRNVSCCFNLVQMAAACLGLFYAIYRSRDAAPLAVSMNMWMNPLEKVTQFSGVAGNEFPTYCNNDAFDFRYDQAWDYSNITCQALPISQIFIKSLSQGVYFISTMMQRHQSKACSDHAPTSLSQLCYPGVPTSKTSFVLGIGDAMLDATVSLTVPDLGIAGDEILPTEIEMPNGTIYPLDRTAGHRFTVNQWIELFGIEDLNAASSGGNVDASIGQSRHRHVGLSIEIQVSVRNTNSVFDLPSNSIDRLKVRWAVTTKQVWTR